MTGPERPLDRLIDTLVYAPVGLVLLAVEELPRLAAHGRRAIESRADLARMVGELTVAQGKRQARSVYDRLQAPLRPDPRAPEAGPAAEPATEGSAPDPVADEQLPVVVAEALPEASAPAEVEPAVITVPAPSAAELPIPGYDSLSASQVVQRLAGLSTEELEAVRAYEQAGRARKTVLLRVAQLRAAS